MSGLDDYERATFCGPNVPAELGMADRCTDWRVKATPVYPTTGIACEGGRRIDGVMVLCDHTCHGLPDRPAAGPRGGL